MARFDPKTGFLLPAVMYVLILSMFPLVLSLYSSFTDSHFGLPEVSFIGAKNYVDAFYDYRFYNSVRVTLFFAVTATLIELGLGLLLAVLMNRDFKFKGAIRALLLIPVFTSPITVTLMGQVILYEGGGGINGILKILGLPIVPWRSNATYAFWTVVLCDIWMWTPFAFLISLAALQAVPKDIIEAAVVDGASSLSLFIRIILPILSPALSTILLFRIVDALKLFEIPLTLLGGGGPGISTESLTVYIYKVGFRGFFFGSASAISFIFLIIVSIVTILLIKRLRKYYV